jgi:hypothetical protein
MKRACVKDGTEKELISGKVIESLKQINIKNFLVRSLSTFVFIVRFALHLHKTHELCVVFF